MPGQDEALKIWELRIKKLDERLRPIANQPVDITHPGWLERLRDGTAPLDEAGVRDAMEGLLAKIITGYAQSTDRCKHRASSPGSGVGVQHGKPIGTGSASQMLLKRC